MPDGTWRGVVVGTGGGRVTMARGFLDVLSIGMTEVLKPGSKTQACRNSIECNAATMHEVRNIAHSGPDTCRARRGRMGLLIVGLMLYRYRLGYCVLVSHCL